MPLTRQQNSIISEYPFNGTLEPFRDKLYNPNGEDKIRRGHIADLLVALVSSPAASYFFVPGGSRNVSVVESLLALRLYIYEIEIDLNPFDSLVHHVVDESSDNVIWAAVFSLIDAFHSRTPLRSRIYPTFNGTPIKTSSSRLADSETREIVEGELFEEMKDCVFRGVGGFWDKFFNPQNWRQEQKAMLNEIITAHDREKWESFPPDPYEKPIWNWLRSLEERFLAGAPYKLNTTKTANQFAERKGQLDLFLSKRVAEAAGINCYKDVLVVGVQKRTHNTARFKADFLQLTRYVRGATPRWTMMRWVWILSLSEEIEDVMSR